MRIRDLFTNTPARSVKTSGLRMSNEAEKKYKVRYPAHKVYEPILDVTFKSKMEKNVFSFLKTRKLDKVEYEPEIWKFKPNKFGISWYVPDFKITDGKRIWYIEVKGFLEKQDLQKAYLCKRDYPWIKIFYILPKQYNLIKKYYAKDIPEWL